MQDFTKAIHYYEMAAKNGSELARENLGYCYYYGRDIPVDYEKAFQCFLEGALCGRLVSMYKIGDMYGNAYLYGEGTEKNPREALKYFHFAEEFLYDLVAEGEEMYRKSLQAAIDGQAKARRILAKNLPSLRWSQE